MTASRLSGDGREVGDLLETQLAEIEGCAERGEWQETEALLKRLPQLVMQIPPSERRPLLLTARSRIETVRERVEHQTRALRGRLGTLKTGQRAAESYRAMNAMGAGPR